MLGTNLFNPCTLFELSVKSIFGVDSKGSINHLMQLSYKETLEAAILVNRKVVSFSKYESISESVSGSEMFPDSWVKFCKENYYLSSNPEELKILLDLSKRINEIVAGTSDMFSKVLPSNVYDVCWSSHPIYKVIYNKSSANIIKNYHEIKNQILSLPEPQCVVKNLSVLPSPEEIAYYYDPLCFFPIGTVEYGSSATAFSCSKDVSIPRSLKFINYSALAPIHDLRKNRRVIRKILYRLAMASLLQINSSISSVARSFSHRNNLEVIGVTEREKLVISSLDIITSLRNFIKDVNTLERTIFSAIKVCNFVPLEEVKKMFERRNPYLFRNDIMQVASFLKIKYCNILIKKKLRFDELMKQLKKSHKLEDNSRLFSTCAYNISKSLKKLEDDIREMEIFMEK
ncbi:hypothetical protein [Candidatus Ichthyocystis hellenicum]|uniref:hypothetical protein n=1 Tax=Candidatus Ichthyocystis hellenicum TaxID=1561003 RepID=UPI0011123E66|nr:hypothetical protein [Candidatus Ichthyocystis hellenicum]